MTWIFINSATAITNHALHVGWLCYRVFLNWSLATLQFECCTSAVWRRSSQHWWFMLWQTTIQMALQILESEGQQKLSPPKSYSCVMNVRTKTVQPQRWATCSSIESVSFQIFALLDCCPTTSTHAKAWNTPPVSHQTPYLQTIRRTSSFKKRFWLQCGIYPVWIPTTKVLRGPPEELQVNAGPVPHISPRPLQLTLPFTTTRC